MTPLETCRALFARVDAASGDLQALSAVYEDTIGPGEIESYCGERHEVLRELSASLGVHWSSVVAQ